MGVYISVGLTEPARDALRASVTELTTPVGHRLTMSDVLLAALNIAHQHEGEFVAALTAEKTHPEVTP